MDALTRNNLGGPSKHTHFENVTINDQAHVQLGDSYSYHVHQEHRADPNKFAILRDSLTFPRMDARCRNIAAPLSNTCEWLVRHKLFLQWADGTGGFLWLKGKPGSGKSTLMKEALRWTEQQESLGITVSYFFNARSVHELEKSSLGLYRSLTYQLINACPSIRKVFERNFVGKVRAEHVEEWTDIELQNFVLDLMSVKVLPRINVFIDALDEGAEDDVRGMLAFCETVLQRASDESRVWRVCVASRHYPNITVLMATSIILDQQKLHEAAILRYIDQKLLGSKDFRMQTVRSKVQQKADGVFLWVVLIIPSLNKAYDRGSSPTIILEKLLSIPSSLLDVFADLLSPQREDFDQCLALLNWVLFAKHPMTIGQLHLGNVLQFQHHQSFSDITEASDDLRSTWLLQCSRGLLETTADTFLDRWAFEDISKRSKEVQFIHETVRDFLLIDTDGRGFHTVSNGSPLRSQLISESTLAEQCLSCVLHFCNNKDWSLLIKNLTIQQLLAYAVKSWALHAKDSAQPISPALLKLSLQLFSYEHIEMLQVIMSLVYPDRHANLVIVQKHLDKTQYDQTSLFYAIKSGTAEVVQDLHHERHLNSNDDLYGRQTILASQLGYMATVATLMQPKPSMGARIFRHLPIKNPHKEIVQLLIRRKKMLSSDQSLHVACLHAAAFDRNSVILQILLQAGMDVNLVDTAGMTALHKAALGGSTAGVKVLAQHNINANIVDDTQRTALHYALGVLDLDHRPDPALIHEILQTGVDVNTRDEDDRSALECLWDTNCSLLEEEAVESLLSDTRRILIFANSGIRRTGPGKGHRAVQVCGTSML